MQLKLLLLEHIEHNNGFETGDGNTLILYPQKNKNVNYKILDGVKTIENSAFLDCSNLRNISLPQGVMQIALFAFNGCSSLVSIEVDDKNGVYASKDGVLFTKDGTKLLRFPPGRKNREYIVPEGVKSIENSTFEGCKNLQSITLPDGVTSIGDSAFEGCKNLKYIILPESLTSIERQAFKDCSRLESITLPEGVTSIGNYGRSVYYYPFDGCSGLRSFTLSKGVTELHYRIFMGFPKLKEIRIPGKNIQFWGDVLRQIRKKRQSIFGFTPKELPSLHFP